jgi:hypothetical protein
MNPSAAIADPQLRLTVISQDSAVEIHGAFTSYGQFKGISIQSRNRLSLCSTAAQFKRDD